MPLPCAWCALGQPAHPAVADRRLEAVFVLALDLVRFVQEQHGAAL
jgi:hypothetical protein